MKSDIAKIITIIVIFSTAVATLIGVITVTRSTDYMEEEIQSNILYTSEKYANEFSAQFNHMEGLTDSLAVYVETSFDMDAYRQMPEQYLDRFEKELAEVIVSDMQTVRNAHSLYVTFSPELTEVGREVWYMMNNGKLEEIEIPAEDLNRDFTIPYDEDMAYFFEPQGKDHGVWIPPYVDQDIQEELFSYSRAIYVDDVFVGVAGADITAGDIVSTIKEMSLYSGGYAVLLDKENNMIVGNDSIGRGEANLILDTLDESAGSGSGSVEYEYNQNEYIMAYSNMDNGWKMAVIIPKDSAYKSTYQLAKAFKILAILLALVLIVFLYVFSRPFIKKQAALEKENREKDLMLMYQSRHAKIGEMFGNITHQWKQPLNSINLIMANLLDSYRYDDLNEERLEKSVNKVANIVDKMSETITDFSGFLKPTKEKDFFDVRDCIKTALSLMEESINQQRINIVITGEENGSAYGYENELVHVIFNILNNARDAIVATDPEDRTIEICIANDGENIEIQITNHGEKIEETVLEHVFDPYFTTKENVGGTGLGLFISRQIVVDRMNGSLYVENVECGVRSRILIPKFTKAEDNDEK